MGWCKYFSQEMRARFGGSTVAGGGPSFSLDFTNGLMPSGMTFTRASTARYFDAGGTLRAAAVNTPRFDYDPVTSQLKGLLLEDTSTNICFQSADVSVVPWGTTNAGGPAAPVITGNLTTAPDGTGAAARVVYPAVSGAGAYSVVYQPITVTAAAHTFSVWLRGNAGGEGLYIGLLGGPSGARITLTTQWRRVSWTTAVLGAGTSFFIIGTDLRDGTQTSTSAQTVFAWGAQLEAVGYPTSYIPTAAAAVTRSADQCYIPIGAWYVPIDYSLSAEFDTANLTSTVCGIGDAVLGNASYFSNGAFARVGSTGTPFGTAITPGATNKQCGTCSATTLRVSNNGGAVASAVNGAASQTTATRLSIGMTPWGSDDQLNGHIRRVNYWNRVLTDGEMQQVTS
jgi:hypothetical protein